MSVELRQGHVLDLLRDMPTASVHCVVTSPPYYALRDYRLEPTIWGGDAEHAHEWGVALRAPWANEVPGPSANHPKNGDAGHWRPKEAGGLCPCGAWRGSLGLEPSPELYVGHLLEVFAEVWRVLRPDGCLFLNLGDSYAGSGKGPSKAISQRGRMATRTISGRQSGAGRCGGEAKSKDLLLMPYRTVMALQAAGWYVRSQIVWHKPACMPESVQDRPTSSWEPIFLLARNARYFFDAQAVREESSEPDAVRLDAFGGANGHLVRHSVGSTFTGSASRNLRNVWSLSPEPFASAHFATFPTSIPDRCIRAGTSEHGCCAECGAPWRRTTSSRLVKSPAHGPGSQMRTDRENGQNVNGWAGMPRLRGEVATTGWQPACKHDAEPVPCTVLDPFAGAGTTLMVADRLGRHAIGLELNPDYVAMAERRVAQDREARVQADRVERELRLGQVGMFAEVGREPHQPHVPRSDKQSELGKKTYVGFNERWREQEHAS